MGSEMCIRDRSADVRHEAETGDEHGLDLRETGGLTWSGRPRVRRVHLERRSHTLWHVSVRRPSALARSIIIAARCHRYRSPVSARAQASSCLRCQK